MKKILIVIYLNLLIVGGGFAQNPSISPQVLNAGGEHRQVGNSGIWLTDNVGEPFTETVGANVTKMMITQGFLQPEKISKAGFTVSPIQQDLICLDKEDDAFISLAINSTVNRYEVKYFWSPPSVCPNNDCPKIDTLKPGAYSVTVAFQYTTNVGAVRYDTLTDNFTIHAASTPCVIKVFSGVSANHDNVNDFFAIENIKEFPNNKVSIYNRWGNLLFETKGYDQDVHDKRWPNDQDLSTLASSTYFYIVDLGNGAKPLKGWIELIKN